MRQRQPRQCKSQPRRRCLSETILTTLEGSSVKLDGAKDPLTLTLMATLIRKSEKSDRRQTQRTVPH